MPKYDWPKVDLLTDVYWYTVNSLTLRFECYFVLSSVCKKRRE